MSETPITRAIIYKDAVTCKLPNRRVTLYRKKGDGYYLQFTRAGKDEHIGEAPMKYEVIKGRAGKLTISLSDEAMDALVFAWKELKKQEPDADLP